MVKKTREKPLNKSLTGIELLKGLSADELTSVARRCQWNCCNANQMIINYQDEGSNIFFIVEGSVRAIRFSASGREVNFNDISAGQTFGELSVIDGRPRSANVVALEDVVLASVSATVFWELLKQYNCLAAAMLRHLVSMVRTNTDRIFEFSTLAVRHRIHAELLRLACQGKQEKNSVLIAPAPTHSDIATRISTHREAVTRELNELARAELIGRRGNALIIRDVAALNAMVQSVLGE